MLNHRLNGTTCKKNMGKEKKSVMGIARPVNMTRYPQNTGSTMPFGTFKRR